MSSKPIKKKKQKEYLIFIKCHSSISSKVVYKRIKDQFPDLQIAVTETTVVLKNNIPMINH